MLGRVADTKKIKVLISASGKLRRLIRKQNIYRVEKISIFMIKHFLSFFIQVAHKSFT